MRSAAAASVPPRAAAAAGCARRVAAAALAAAALGVPAGAAARPACAAATGADRIEAVGPEGEPILRDRGTVRLSGVRLAEGEPGLAWLKARVGRDVLVAAGTSRDRWDRLPARLVLASGAERLDVAHGLLERGLAVVDPATAEPACLPEALAIEETARERALGLWALDRYKPVPVWDVARLSERIGQFTIVEGRIRSVGERRQQTYLNFGTNWATDFTIVVPKQVWSRLQEQGLGQTALAGRRIRARGVLEERQGPVLTVRVRESLEIIGADGRR